MSDEDVAKIAKENGSTRATASMDKAAGLDKKLIFAIGNAPTALVRLYELIEEKKLDPDQSDVSAKEYLKKEAVI